MAPAPLATDPLRLEAAALRRRPVDRLFVVCVLGAGLAYLGFVAAMQLMPPEASSESARQGYLGAVSGESQPPGLGAEADPAPGTALREGPRAGTYLSKGGPPRPIEAIEPSSPYHIPATAIARGQLPATPSPDRGPALGFDMLWELAPAAAWPAAAAELAPSDRGRLGPWTPRNPPTRQLSPP